MLKHFFLILIFFTFFQSYLPAQVLNDRDFINFTVEDGLPSNEVYEVFEDSKGYLWIATDRGVARYNGYEFVTYTIADGLPDDTIFNFYEDKKGRIWFFSFNGRVGFYFNERFTTLNIKVPHKIILGMTVNNNQVEVLYSYSISLETKLNFELKDNSAINIRWSKQSKADVTNAIINGRHKLGIHVGDSICLKNASGFLKLDGFGLKNRTQLSGINNFTGVNFLAKFNGELEEIKFANDTMQLTTVAQLKTYIPSGIIKDSYGGLWVATLNKGILYASNPKNYVKEFDVSVSKKGLSRYFKNDQYEIIINNDKELFKKNKGNYKKVATLQGTLGYIYKEGERYFVNSQNEVIEFDSLGKAEYKYKLFLKNLIPFKLTGLNGFRKLKSLNDEYVTCYSNKIHFLKDSSFIEIDGAKRLTHLYAIKDTLWAGGLEGLFAVNIKSKKNLKKNTDYRLNQRVSYLSGIHNWLLVATRGNGLYLKKGEQIVSIKKEDGLIDNSLSKIVTDKQHTIWVSSNKGVSKITFTSFTPLSYTIDNITKEDGLLSLKINDLQYYQDKILVLTDELLHEFPKVINRPTINLKFYVKEVKVNGQTVRASVLNKLEHYQNNIEINYEAVYYPNPEGLYYKYSNDGGDTWKVTNSRRLNFLNLNYGAYTFLVKAVNANGIESNVKSIQFTIAAPFWKTAWFLSISLLLAAIILILIIRNILKQNRMKNKVVEMELKALKSQMNPHFSFNSMNSIQSFILENKQDEALAFIAKYSKLIRLILNNSAKPFISLQEEINALQLYLDIEQVRLNNKFSYQFLITSEIDPDAIKIPSMILQPYIENAIWHGISNKEGRGSIQISFTVKNNILNCSIEDDGVGRLKAQALKSKRSIKYKSFGLDITNERVKLINSSRKIMGVKIIDLYDVTKKPTGTRVEIKVVTK